MCKFVQVCSNTWHGKGCRIVYNHEITSRIPHPSNRRTCPKLTKLTHKSWWRHQMETFSALLALCAGNSPVTDEFLAQRPVTRSFDVFFDLRLNKQFNKQSWDWWFETLSRSLWRHCNVLCVEPTAPIGKQMNFKHRLKMTIICHFRIHTLLTAGEEYLILEPWISYFCLAGMLYVYSGNIKRFCRVVRGNFLV